MADVLLLSGDLMCASRVAAAAAALGLTVQSAAPNLVALAAPVAPSAALPLASGALVVIDLQAPGLNLPKLTAALRQQSPPPRRIIAFGPHVQTVLLDAARAAGCEVLTRGQFFSQLDEAAKGAAKGGGSLFRGD
jgi:DNA-binding NarL/FixJ family response regulator